MTTERIPYMGFILLENPYMTVLVAHPRSPARAKRRAAQGYRQCMRAIPSPDLYRMEDRVMGHPETIAKLRRELWHMYARSTPSFTRTMETL